MKQRLALFIALIFCAFACKSSRLQDLESTLAVSVDFNEPQTYAKLADERVHQSFQALLKDVDNLDYDLPPSQIHTLEKNLIEFEDMLEIFVHVLPMREDEDPFLDLYASLEEGRILLGRLRTSVLAASQKAESQKGLLTWVQSLASEPVRKRYEQYLAALNRSTATRRTIPVMESYCWGRVDYIPELKAPAAQELQAFMKALLNATRIASQEAKEIDDILSPDQRQAYEATRRKSRSILAINSYFPLVFGDQGRLQKALPVVKAVSEHYEHLQGMLDAYDAIKDKKSPDAQNLGKKIALEWSAIKSGQGSAGTI